MEVPQCQRDHTQFFKVCVKKGTVSYLELNFSWDSDVPYMGTCLSVLCHLCWTLTVAAMTSIGGGRFDLPICWIFLCQIPHKLSDMSVDRPQESPGMIGRGWSCYCISAHSSKLSVWALRIVKNPRTVILSVSLFAVLKLRLKCNLLAHHFSCCWIGLKMEPKCCCPGCAHSSCTHEWACKFYILQLLPSLIFCPELELTVVSLDYGILYFLFALWLTKTHTHCKYIGKEN